MADAPKKRTLDAFFKPPPKKPRLSDTGAVAGNKDGVDKFTFATSEEVSKDPLLY